jgi:hypothetical protein
VPLCLVILIQQTLRNGFDLNGFGGFHGKMFLRVDFRFLLIEWVLGTELLAKGSVNTKNWDRKGTDLWAEFGNEIPFGRQNSSQRIR